MANKRVCLLFCCCCCTGKPFRQYLPGHKRRCPKDEQL